MEQDKIVEQFSAWLAAQEREQLEMGNERFTGTELGCMSMSWNAAWQASREALVVELPTSEFFDDGENEYGYKVSAEAYRADATLAAIHASGIRTR